MSDYSPQPSFSGAKLPLRPMHVWGIRVRLQVDGRIRDLALFDLAIDSKLRGCDVVALRVGDVVSAGAVRRRAIVLQQKTGRPVQFEITDQTRQSIARWLERRPSYGGDWLFPSRLWPGQHLSTRQYSRLVKWWADLIGLEPSGCPARPLPRPSRSRVSVRPVSGVAWVGMGHPRSPQPSATVRNYAIDRPSA